MWGCHALMHFYRVLSWKWLSAPIAQFQLIYSLRWTSCTLIPFGAKQSLKKRLLMPAYYGLRFALEASFKWHLQNWCQGNQMSVTLVNSPVVASFWPDIFLHCDVIHWMPYVFRVLAPAAGSAQQIHFPNQLRCHDECLLPSALQHNLIVKNSMRRSWIFSINFPIRPLIGVFLSPSLYAFSSSHSWVHQGMMTIINQSDDLGTWAYIWRVVYHRLQQHSFSSRLKDLAAHLAAICS